MKLLSPLRFLATALCATMLTAAGRADAAIVSFSFSGVINYIYNPTNALPSGIGLGTPFAGTITYDTSGATSDQDPRPDLGDYYYTNGASFSFMVTVGSHTFTCLPPNDGNVFAGINICKGYNNEHSISLGDSPLSLRMDGAVIPGAADVGGGFSFYLRDTTLTAYSSDALPAVPPQLNAFASEHTITIQAMSDSINDLFYFSGNVTNITAVPVVPGPSLVIRSKAGDMVEVAWPLSAQGFTLQYAANLASGPAWQTEPTPVVDTASEHTVTLTANGAKFFRLKK